MSNPNERTAKLTSAPNEAVAALVISALEDLGIKASSDETTSDLRAGAWNWIDILVDENDLAQAQEALQQIKQENSEIDWSQIDVGQPEDE